ncbi:LrgB family protein [Aneurinibacillus tyrosinisolvens]|uniref:LrgB family protein n=1 Tax=Aneurinibacillus tyrosinisolvens TaxID=1443435 RepID=UPI00063F5E0D|nr:LrgB family protein [Aneurinibacillus tyrosinisolvens]
MMLYHMIMWIILTSVTYVVGCRVHKKLPYTWSSPVFFCPALLILILWLTHTNYPTYRSAAQPLTFFLGPLQLAMVIPIYRYASVLKQYIFTILTGVFIGTCSGILFVIGLSRLFHFSLSTIASLAPKSVTAPMAVSVSHTLGGLPELTAVFTMMTAVIGMLIGPIILRWMGIKNKMARGLALGTAASMVGAARAAQWGELEGTMGMLGMVLSALLMPILAPELLSILF